MENQTVVQEQTAVDATPVKRVNVFRWQKYVDGKNRLWIVVLTFGFDERGIHGANVELLDVDAESTIEVPRAEFEQWVRSGTLKRCEVPIMI